jgi:hypothetical protein
MNTRINITHSSRDLHFDAVAPEIRAEVQAEFADEFAKASPLRRILLRFEMSREIRRRLASAVSQYSLY